MNIEKCLNVLDLDINATPTEIKKAYKELVQIWHPDKYLTHSNELQNRVNNKIREINIAYESLKSFIMSDRYDSSTISDSQDKDSSASSGEKQHKHKTYQVRDYPIEIDRDNYSVSSFGLKPSGNSHSGIPTKLINNVFVTECINTITDLSTGIMWHKWPEDIDYNREIGPIELTRDCYDRIHNFIENYLDMLRNGKYSDWRLPTVDELLSLVGYTKNGRNDGSYCRCYQLNGLLNKSYDLITSDQFIINFEGYRYYEPICLRIYSHDVTLSLFSDIICPEADSKISEDPFNFWIDFYEFAILAVRSC